MTPSERIIVEAQLVLSNDIRVVKACLLVLMTQLDSVKWEMVDKMFEILEG